MRWLLVFAFWAVVATGIFVVQTYLMDVPATALSVFGLVLNWLVVAPLVTMVVIRLMASRDRPG